MKIIGLNISSVLAALSIAAGCYSQTYTYTNAYLDIGVNARALGLSNAYTSVSEDASSIYWNPAGLTRLKNSLDISLMHNEHFGGIVKYDFGAIGIKAGEKNGLGFGVIRSGVDNIPNTLELIDSDGRIRYDRITAFSVADYAFFLSFARKMPVKGLSVGGSMKVLHRNIGEFGKGWGFGIDLGAQYQYRNLRAGILLRDVSTTVTNFSYNTETFEETFALTGNEILRKSSELALPQIVIGASYRQWIDKKQRYFVRPSLDWIITTDGKRNVLVAGRPLSMDPRIGVEIGYKDIVFIRGGVGQFQRSKGDGSRDIWLVKPNIGAGFRVKTIFIDYALASLGNQSTFLFSHVFSLRVGLNLKSGKKKSE